MTSIYIFIIASILRIAINTEPNTVEPSEAADFVSSTLVCMTQEGLTRSIPGGGVKEALAQTTDISSDGLHYTFHLRDAFWSDGQKITAQDVEKAWKKIISNKMACTYLFYPIKNVELYVQGKTSLDQVGIHAHNNKTLQVVLEKPTSYFYKLTANPNFLIAKQGAFSGPFCIERREKNKEIVLTKNNAYWDKEHIFLSAVQMQIIPEETTTLALFEKRALDWIGGSLSPLPLDALPSLQDQVQHIPSAASTFCVFNTQKFPFNHSAIRKAFSAAISRKDIIEKLLENGQEPACHVLPPSLTSGNTSLWEAPEKARELLQTALEELHADRSIFTTTCLYVKPGQIDRRLASILQAEWQRHLGITIPIVQLDYKSHARRLQSKDFTLALASWIAQFDDPICILERFKDPNARKNYAGWSNTAFSKAIEGGLFAIAEDILTEELPILPLFHWNQTCLCSPNIAELLVTPSGAVLFEYFKLNEQK